MGNCEMICNQLTSDNHEIRGPDRAYLRNKIENQKNTLISGKIEVPMNHSQSWLISPQQKYGDNTEVEEIDSDQSPNQIFVQGKEQIINQRELFKQQNNEKPTLIFRIMNVEKMKGVYKGYVLNDKFHKYGVYYSFQTGTVYRGEFNLNKMEGIGEEKWKTGETYFGEYKNNEKNGIGTLIISENVTFSGEFLNNKINGKGTFIFSGENIKIQGEFRDNNSLGYGIYCDDNRNRLYEGEMSINGDWEGFGVMVDKANHLLYVGEWHESKLTGTFALIRKNKGKFEINKFFCHNNNIKEIKNDKDSNDCYLKIFEEFSDFL